MKYAATAAVFIALLTATATADAAVDARLAGKFRVTAYGGGATVYRIYAFHPQCRVAVCRKVSMRRESRQNRHYKSMLKRVSRGEYKGLEHSKGRCRNGERWQGKVKWAVFITKKDNGRAQAIRGRAKATTQGCSDFASHWRFNGTLR